MNRRAMLWPVTSPNIRENLVAGLVGPIDGGGFGGGLQLFASCTGACFVDSNTFTSNSVSGGDGGGMYASAPKSLTITNNVFDSNESGEHLGYVLALWRATWAF